MQVGIFDIFLALVPMGPILVSIDETFPRNQYRREYPYSALCERYLIILSQVVHANGE